MLADLGASGSDCLCIEDSRKGLLAARAAAIRSVVAPSLYGAGEDLTGVDLILRSIAEPWSPGEFPPATTLAHQRQDISSLFLG